MPSTIVSDAVAARLEQFVIHITRDSDDYGPDAPLFLDAARTALTGGKRLRARFCHSGWQAAEGADEDLESLWGLCAALEIFQSAALVHDDLIDNSDERRGRPAAHRALEAAHRTAGWQGDAAAFGRSSAVLLGDLLVAWSDDLLEETLLDHPNAPATRAEYARMRRDVTVGQMLDVAEESAWSVGAPERMLERALHVASLKSARYSVAEPLVLGATLAGADADLLASLREIGHPLGMAFQLRDDLLGVFGDPAVTGKPAGDDLREGKRTVLIAVARELLSTERRAQLDAALGNATLSPGAVSSLQRLIQETGAIDRVENMISGYTDQAERALAAADINIRAADTLRELRDAAVARSA